MLRENVKTFGTSLVLHAGAVALLATLAARQVINPGAPPLDFEIVPAAAMTTPKFEPPPPVDEEEPPPSIPETARPKTVPEQTRVEKVDRAKPYSEQPTEATREAPEDVEAVAPPTAPVPEIAMASTVGAAGTDYVTTSASGEGTVPIAAGAGGGRGHGGGGRGTTGPTADQGASDIVVSPDWQITDLPEPLNDGDFEPVYPPLAKREGREAVVVLQLYIDAEGRVTRSEVLEGPKGGHGFERSAREYAARLRFRPARANRREVASRIEWSVYFYVRN